VSPPRPLAILLLLALTTPALAYLFQPTPVPDGLSRAQAWLKDRPNNAEGYFFLGRANGFAWANGDGQDARLQIASFGNGDAAPFFVPWESLMYQRQPTIEVTNAAKKYLTASLVAYQKALDLEKTNARYLLALAWALEQAATCRLLPPPEIAPASKLTAADNAKIQAAITQLSAADFTTRDQAGQTLHTHMPAAGDILLNTKTQDPEVAAQIDVVFRRYWTDLAVAHYRQAYALSVEKDLKSQQYDPEADTTLSVKAGQRLQALIPPGPASQTERIRIEETLKTILAKPQLAHFYG
jgi:hypothetical protein